MRNPKTSLMLCSSILLAAAIWLPSSTVQATTGRNKQTMSEVLPAYAITNYTDLLNSSRCRTDIEMFREGVDRGMLWSIRMLDASGQTSSGFVSGNNFWMGDRMDCNFLSSNLTLVGFMSKETLKNNSVYRNPRDEQVPFELHFFVADILHHSTMQYHLSLPYEDHILLGLCLPASCTKNDVATVLSKALRDGNLLVGQLYSTDLQLINVSDLVDDHQWLRDGSVITSIIILLLLCVLVIVSTAYEILVIRKRTQDQSRIQSYENNNTPGLKNDAEEKRENVHEDFVLTELKPRSSIEEYIVCFSLYSNILQIFDGKTGTDSLMMFHSMKFFGMIWITMVHTVYYGRFYVANKIDVLHMTASFMLQILTNATYSVDTYFFISGFLLSYILLKEIEKEQKPKSLPVRLKDLVLGIFKRYIRLTPAYLVVMLLSILNFNWYDKVSLFPASENEASLCSKYWWRNLLYIHNFYDFDQMCLSWSWYLATDMQFFIFGTLLMMVLTKYYNVAVGLGATTILASILSTAYVAYYLNYVPMLDQQLGTLTFLYIRPWTRISPYLMGMGTALYLVKQNYKLHLSKKVLLVGWTLAILCNCSILFGLVDKDLSSFLSILYVSVTRTAWGLGIAWLVLMCITNHGGILNKFLTLRAWVPLGRLTYCAYLINPFIIVSLHRANSYSLYIDVLSVGSIGLGVLLVTYVCAVCLSSFAEVSFIRILRIINRGSRMK
ncbi:nose resistant to fluoxetine protein 6-like [Ceratina calcarata]|uniref:Nose resistant to fluoxetine protein 6-like n=1 Tax=Ceratina calcarata TaxID=156304 RepID=A0AAJ7IZT3_9HYME|nr:nose resistant to fluoxetine protein 6-like [Ceratina calcarata]